MVWLPFWLIGHAMTLVSGALGQPWTPNGFTIDYNLAIRFETAILGLSTLFMMFSLARKYVDKNSAAVGVLATAIGSPFYWYWFNGGDGSHVPASFVIALFLKTWDHYRSGSRDRWVGFLVGLLGGLATIVKPNHVVIFLFPLAMWIKELKVRDRVKLFHEMIPLVGGACLAILLQFWIWNILFGNPLGPILEKGITHYYGFFNGKFWLLDVLFSSYHGLFFFAPVLVFSFYGLYKLIRVDSIFAIPSLLILIFHIALMANERYLWEGASFGLRRIVDWTPVFAIGLCSSIPNLKKPLKAFLAVAVSWTILLMIAYNARPLGILNEYQPPAEILNWVGSIFMHLPSTITGLFHLPAPPAIFLPAFFLLSIPGYFLFYGIIRLNESHRASKVLVIILVCLLASVYALISRAAIRGEASLEKWKVGLQWLAQNQTRISANEDAAFLINEGKYIALSRNWNDAMPSFQQALSRSSNRNAALADIRRFASTHLSQDQAQIYIETLKQR